MLFAYIVNRKRSAKTEVKEAAREEVQELDADVLAALAAHEEYVIGRILFVWPRLRYEVAC